MKPILAITSCSSEAEAKKLALLLVEKKLAACVQVQAAMTSIYAWQAKVEKSAEFALHIKTIDLVYPEIEKIIKENHSYEVPEILAISVDFISDDYLAWMKMELGLG